MLCETTCDNIDCYPLESKLEKSGMGAIASFRGYVRNDASGQISSIYVEEHPLLTLPSIKRIVLNAQERFELNDCVLIHRVGKIALNELIVGVATTSLHRQNAFDACMYIMDFLKNEAFFWKKECFLDGTSRWVDMKQRDVAQKDLWQSQS